MDGLASPIVRDVTLPGVMTSATREAYHEHSARAMDGGERAWGRWDDRMGLGPPPSTADLDRRPLRSMLL